MKKAGPIATQDGSHTLFSELTGEHYHSVFGAVQESEHIFIGAGLNGFGKRPAGILRVLEIGFGTGLNALLTLKWAESHKTKVAYEAVEAYPLDFDTLQALNYPAMLSVDPSLFLQLHRASGIRSVTPWFSLQLFYTKFQDYQPVENRFHVVFFDAFSPESQPEMWSRQGFEKLYKALVDDGVLVTYSCKGTVKRALKAAGFQIEKLPGPPGKREFLRAVKRKRL